MSYELTESREHRLNRLFNDPVPCDFLHGGEPGVAEPVKAKPSPQESLELLAKLFDALNSSRAQITITVGAAEPIKAIINGKEQDFGSPAEKFHALASVWSAYNAGRSVTEYQHAAYLQVIGMGREAIPFLLREVVRGNSNWLLALRYITGAVVTKPEMRGDLTAIRRAWNEWGIANGFGDQLR